MVQQNHNVIYNRQCVTIYIFKQTKLVICGYIPEKCSTLQTMNHVGQGQTITNNKISFKVESTSAASKVHADKPGTSQTTVVLTGQCFGALALRFSSSMPSFLQPASHMSWVKQKKILNCLLFLSAGTGKWSGDRQMSLSASIERQKAYKALLPMPVPLCGFVAALHLWETGWKY